MEDNLVIVHIAYIIGLVYFVFRSGEKNGRRQMVEDFLDRDLITQDKLEQVYKIKSSFDKRNEPKDKS